MEISRININNGINTVFRNLNGINNIQRNNQIADTISFKSRPTDKNYNEIITNEDSFSEFANGIINNPRSSQQAAQNFIKQAGSVDNFLNWYFKPGGYKDNYAAFIKKAVETAKTPEDLLKISPNWGPWVFENKFGSDFVIGQVPDDIGDINDYRLLVNKLLKGENTEHDIKELGGGLSGKRAFMIKTGKHKYVLKTQQDYTIYSEKLKKAIEEDSWLKDTFLKNYKENENMKSDSSYINAMIDFYLNLNDCPNAIKIHCFDAQTSSVLYECAEGEAYAGDIDVRSVNKLMPDLRKLGIIYNDVSRDNLKVQNGEIKIIDSGESSFIDVLKPTIPGYNFEMPNWSGNNLISLIAGINLFK